MNKKIIILLIIISILFAAGGGFFLWFHYIRLSSPEEWLVAEPVGKETFLIENKGGKKIIKNEKLGMVFVPPENWKIKYGLYENDPRLVLLSPEVKDIKGYFFQIFEQGCAITLTGFNLNANLTSARKAEEKRISESILTHQGFIDNDKYKVLEINGREILQHSLDYKPWGMRFVISFFFLPHKVPAITLLVPIQDYEKCSSVYKKFLNDISFEQAK